MLIAELAAMIDIYIYTTKCELHLSIMINDNSVMKKVMSSQSTSSSFKKITHSCIYIYIYIYIYIDTTILNLVKCPKLSVE